MYSKVSPGDVPLSTGNEEYFVRNYGSADPTYSTCVRDVALLTRSKGAEENCSGILVGATQGKKMEWR